MDLTVGPNQFFWSTDRLHRHHADLAAAPVARVVLGELVCSKRLLFWQDSIAPAIEALQAAGKEVALTTLALITLKRERRLAADLADMGLPVEVNDLSALAHIPQGTPFWVGPMVNVYNEGTLRWLAGRGAVRICLPPELPPRSMAILAGAARKMGVAIEVWGHGRLPLAISGRCYHARLHDRAKDSCQFVCADDPDGREVDTLEGQKFLVVNGVQTLSHAHACHAHHVEALRDMGVDALRLSPQSQGFGTICAGYAKLLAGEISADNLVSMLTADQPGDSYCDGFASGGPGVAWRAAAAV